MQTYLRYMMWNMADYFADWSDLIGLSVQRSCVDSSDAVTYIQRSSNDQE